MTLTFASLISLALMSFGCATSNPTPKTLTLLPPGAEQDQVAQNSDKDVSWEWEALWWVMGIGGIVAAGKNVQ
jgi:hypothetical protein